MVLRRRPVDQAVLSTSAATPARYYTRTASSIASIDIRAQQVRLCMESRSSNTYRVIFFFCQPAKGNDYVYSILRRYGGDDNGMSGHTWKNKKKKVYKKTSGKLLCYVRNKLL